MINLSKDALISVEALKAADNETLTGAGVDMAGFDSVCFHVCALKGEALDFSIKAQQAAESDFSDAADLEGTSVAFSTTVEADGQAMLDIHRPSERYVRALVTVPDATNPTLTSCIAIRYNAREPATNDNAELHVTPDEGTA